MQALGSQTIFSRSSAKGIIWNSNQCLQLHSFLFATVMLPSVQLTLSMECMPAASERCCLFTIIPLPSLKQLEDLCMVIIDMAYESIFFKITSSGTSRTFITSRWTTHKVNLPHVQTWLFLWSKLFFLPFHKLPVVVTSGYAPLPKNLQLSFIRWHLQQSTNANEFQYF